MRVTRAARSAGTPLAMSPTPTMSTVTILNVLNS